MYIAGLKSLNSQSDKLIHKFIHSFNINKMCKFIQMNIIKQMILIKIHNFSKAKFHI